MERSGKKEAGSRETKKWREKGNWTTKKHIFAIFAKMERTRIVANKISTTLTYPRVYMKVFNNSFPCCRLLLDRHGKCDEGPESVRWRSHAQYGSAQVLVNIFHYCRIQ